MERSQFYKIHALTTLLLIDANYTARASIKDMAQSVLRVRAILLHPLPLASGIFTLKYINIVVKGRSISSLEWTKETLKL